MTSVDLTRFDAVNALEYSMAVLNGNKPLFLLPKSFSSVQYMNTPSLTGAGNSNQTQYYFQLAQDNLLSNYMYEEVQFRCDITTVNSTDVSANVSFNSVGIVAPKFMPLNRITSSLQTQLNATPLVSQPTEIMDALFAFNKSPEMPAWVSCQQQDRYSDLPTGGGTLGQSAYASLVNPMLDYFSKSYGFTPRMATQVDLMDNLEVPANSTVQNRFWFTVREPILSGVHALTNDQALCWAGLQSFKLTRTFSSNINNAVLNVLPSWNSVNEADDEVALTCTGVTVAVQSPTLYYTIITPLNSDTIPSTTYYKFTNYQNLQQFPCNKALPAYDENSDRLEQQVLQTSPQYTMTYVPSCIYLWASSKQQSAKLFSDTHTFLSITSLSLSVYSNNSQFNSMLPVQLYQEFSAKQGYNYEFFESGGITSLNETNNTNGLISRIGGVGSVLRIPVTSLIGIDWSKYSVGSALPTNMNFTIGLMNPSQNAIDANQAYISMLPIYEDCIVNEGYRTSIYPTLLTDEQFKQVRALPYKYDLFHPIMGAGNLFRDVISGIKKGTKWVKENKNELRDIAQKVKKITGLGRKKTSRRGSHHSTHRMHGGAVENNDYTEDSQSDSYSDDDDEQVTIPKKGFYSDKPLKASKSSKSSKSILKYKY